MISWRNFIFIGTYGHVAALRKKSGKKVWCTSLPKTGYSVVSILVEDETLFCASGGRVFALDPVTGEILWSNGLRGLGMGGVFITTANSNNSEAILTLLEEELKKKRAASSSAGSVSSS